MMKGKLFRFFLLAVTIVSCSDSLYYKRVLNGAASGSESSVEYEMIVPIIYEGKDYELSVTNQEFFTEIKDDYSFKSYTQYVAFMRRKLKKGVSIPIKSSKVFIKFSEGLQRIVVCDSSSKLNQMRSNTIFQLFIDERTSEIKNERESSMLDSSNALCFNKNILKDKSVFIYTFHTYGGIRSLYFDSFKKTSWIETDGINPIDYDPREYMGLLSNPFEWVINDSITHSIKLEKIAEKREGRKVKRHIVKTDSKEFAKEDIRFVPYESWMKLLENPSSDWAANLVLYEYYMIDSSALKGLDRSGWISSGKKKSDIGFWKDFLVDR